MEVRSTLVGDPYFSICIPQYNRTSFVIEALKSLREQTLKDFEVCISDDFSTDGREGEILGFLKKSGLTFVYEKQKENKKYDGNLRASLALAKGKFCFLLGNDDCLASPKVLETLKTEIERFDFREGIIITNYEDFATGKRFRRVPRTGILGQGPEAAVAYFRNFSFLSGIILDRENAQKYATDRWDGSEMYQMFIGCRILSEGRPLLGIDEVTVRQGIRIATEEVDSYKTKPRLDPCPVVERRIPLNIMGRFVTDVVNLYLEPSQKRSAAFKVFFQIFVFTYPFWIFEYRRVQSWKYALGICLGMRPKNSLEGIHLDMVSKIYLILVYATVTLLGLLVPLPVFDRLYPCFYSIAKSYATSYCR